MSIYELTARPGTRIVGKDTNAQIMTAVREQLSSRRKLTPGTNDIHLPNYENSSFAYSVSVDRWGGRGRLSATPKVQNAWVRQLYGTTEISFPIQQGGESVQTPIDELHNIIPIMEVISQSESVLHKVIVHIPSTFWENLRDVVRLPVKRRVK